MRRESFLSMCTIITLAVIGFAIFANNAMAVDHYVRADADNPVAPYSSWATATDHIDRGVDATQSGETCWVSNGTYHLNWGPLWANANETIKSVNGAEVTIINGNYPAITNRGFVIQAGGIVDGFTVTNCHPGTQAGAGVLLFAGGTLQNSIVEGCSAISHGGGVYAYSGVTMISNCVVRNNIASNNGGGCYIAGEGLVIDCDIYGNQASVLGGGIAFYREGNLSTTQMRNSRIYNNTTPGDGGGIFLEEGTIKDCIISNNVSGQAGGGICVISQGETLVENCVLTKNLTNKNGGGIYFVSGATPGYIRNCLISGNLSTNSLGGGLAINSTSARIENCTIVRNHSKNVGGGIFNNNTATVISNTVVWNNLSDSTDEDIYSTAGSITYSCSPDLTAGVDNNITGDPQFIDSGSGYGTNAVLGDYRLASGSSPCVNAGNNGAWMIGAVDLDGNVRINGGVVEIGAYEYFLQGTIIVVK